MPASKALETSLVCTRSAQFALSSGVNDDFTCDKVEKKSSWDMFTCKHRSNVRLLLMEKMSDVVKWPLYHAVLYAFYRIRVSSINNARLAQRLAKQLQPVLFLDDRQTLHRTFPQG
jgi:hypothetical protein